MKSLTQFFKFYFNNSMIWTAYHFFNASQKTNCNTVGQDFNIKKKQKFIFYSYLSGQISMRKKKQQPNNVVINFPSKLITKKWSKLWSTNICEPVSVKKKISSLWTPSTVNSEYSNLLPQLPTDILHWSKLFSLLPNKKWYRMKPKKKEKNFSVIK